MKERMTCNGTSVAYLEIEIATLMHAQFTFLCVYSYVVNCDLLDNIELSITFIFQTKLIQAYLLKLIFMWFKSDWLKI